MPKAKKRRRHRPAEYQPREGISPIIKPKLTPADVREIRKIYRLNDKLRKEQGRTLARPGLMQDLATKYGVSIWTIKHIRTGDRWSTLR